METIIFHLAYITGFFVFLVVVAVFILAVDAIIFGMSGKSFLFALESWLFK